MTADSELHRFPLIPDQWWACDQPERPIDNLTILSPACPKCRLKASVELANGRNQIDTTFSNWVREI
jgi:hypothetical protein